MSPDLTILDDAQVPLYSPADACALFLRGKRIGLRPLTTADAGAHYLGWLNDPDITRHLETGAFPQTLEALQRYVSQATAAASGFPTCLFFAIQHLQSGAHIGNIKLEPIHWLHRTASVGILIGDTRHHGQGLGEEAMRLCLTYAFERLGLRKVSLGVLANNERALRLYERLGFVIEGRKRQEYWSHGAFQDRIDMGLFREEFRIFDS